MTRSIQFTPPARAQFLSAIDYIRAERPSAARAFRDRSMASLKNLIRFPEAGRTIPEFPQLGFREVLVGRHRFFYRLEGDVIWVVGVWHDAQLPAEPESTSGVEPGLRAAGAPVCGRLGQGIGRGALRLTPKDVRLRRYCLRPSGNEPSGGIHRGRVIS